MGGLFGSKKSSSSSSTATTNNDNRQVNTSTVTTTNNADAAQIVKLNAELLRDVSADQTDTVKTIAGFGADTIRTLGGAVTDLYDNAGNQTSAAWTHTIDKSAEAFENLLTTARSTTDTARSLAEQALQTYQPADSKMGDTFKYSAIAAAVVVALMVMKKA